MGWKWDWVGVGGGKWGRSVRGGEGGVGRCVCVEAGVV